MALLLSVAEPSHQSYRGIYHWQWRPLKAIQCYDAYSAFSRGFLTDKRLVWANDNSAGQTGRVRFDRKIPVKQNLVGIGWRALPPNTGTGLRRWSDWFQRKCSVYLFLFFTILSKVKWRVRVYVHIQWHRLKRFWESVRPTEGRSEHIAGSKERYSLGQNTTCELSG